MMLSRRSIFLAVGAAIAGVFGAKAQDKWQALDPRVRNAGKPYVCTPQQYEAGECLATAETFGGVFPKGMLITGNGIRDSVSLGNGLIAPVDSPEGQAVLKSMAAPNAGKSRW